jgi:ribosomal protein S18 acetylase RimI-like enzyme
MVLRGDDPRNNTKHDQIAAECGLALDGTKSDISSTSQPSKNLVDSVNPVKPFPFVTGTHSRMKAETSINPNLTIRCGKPNDAALLAQLGARTFSDTFAADNTLENMADYLASAFTLEQQAEELADPQCMFQIAEINGVPVGYAMLRAGNEMDTVTGDKPIELVRLYVSQESLGSGVGGALMQACIDEAKQGGYQTLWLGVWEHNPRARAFYRKWNFQDVGTHVFHLGDDPQTDIVMERSIAE